MNERGLKEATIEFFAREVMVHRGEPHEVHSVRASRVGEIVVVHVASTKFLLRVADACDQLQHLGEEVARGGVDHTVGGGRDGIGTGSVEGLRIERVGLLQIVDDYRIELCEVDVVWIELRATVFKKGGHQLLGVRILLYVDEFKAPQTLEIAAQMMRDAALERLVAK